jgi:hypothetical protein
MPWGDQVQLPDSSVPVLILACLALEVDFDVFSQNSISSGFVFLEH